MSDRGIIGKTIENYRIEQMIGQGGMAAVYKAFDMKLMRPVAIKVMHPHLASQKSFQGRFLQEARAAASLDHPNIVRVLAFNNIDNDLYLVMELITGGNLRQYVKALHEDARFIDYPEAIEVSRQMAEALEYAHQRGMIHRDIKPDNVLLKPDKDGLRINYKPILTDFGLAKLTSSGEDAVTDQQPIGTYPYMSPEQCLADEVDTRTDIYALGIMLYELAVGRLPYHPKTIAEAARMHGREPLTLPSAIRPGFPTDLEEIIVTALAKNPADRHQSAGEMSQALQALLKPVTVRPKTEEAPVIGVPRAKRTLSEEDEVIITDLATAIQAIPLPEQMPDYPTPELTPEQAKHDRLVFFSADHPQLLVPLDKDVFNIGRDPRQDVILEGGSASRHYIQVERKPNGKYYIIDLQSTNGVWLDDTRLTPNLPVILDPGVVVRLGDYWMRLDAKEVRADEPDEVIYGEFDGAGVGDDAVEVAAVVDEPVVEKTGPEDSIPTEVLLAPTAREMPKFSPPPLTADQLAFDRLIFYSSEYATQTIKMTKDKYTIGRAANQDIVLQGRAISRRHARIERLVDGKFYLTDLGSWNGTWIDGDRLEANLQVRLDPNKIVRLGDYWVEYQFKRDIPIPISTPAPTFEATSEIVIDALATVEMVKPLAEELPQYSPPPLTPEMRASDRLLFYSEDHPMQVIKLDKEIITIGRAEDQDVILQGKRVSRQHVRLELTPDGYIYATDTSSRNGVWMGDTLLVPDTPVQWDTNELIRIGNYWLKFERGTRVFDPFAGITIKDNYGRVGKRIKNYRIDRFLGQNPLTSVYKATELPLEREVALKIMHPNLAAEETLKQRFLQEARLSSRLDHPNIVRVLSYDNVDNELFMVMELIKGGSLRAQTNQLRDEGKQMELADIVTMTIRMADALHYAHQQGMVHRDLKPETVVLKPTVVVGPITKYEPVLTDFAAAQISESGDIYITEKPEGNFPYMSPEQVMGERVDIRSDIYELGVIMYEMLVGNPPYRPRSIAEAVRMHAREPIKKPSDFRLNIPDDLEKALLKALEKEPNNRYQTAIEFARALQRVSVAGVEGIASSPFPGAGGVGGVAPVGPLATQLMPIAIPAQMPLRTVQPITPDQLEHDRMVLYSDTFPTRTVTLNKEVYTIGRDSDQDIVLSSDKISKRHARLERGLGGIYRITDLGSKNGTYLGNYKLLHNVAEIWQKDETLRIGEFWLRIEDAESLKIDKTPRRAVLDDDGYKTDAPLPGQPATPVRPAEPKPASPEQDKIAVNAPNTIIRVAPGSSGTMSVEVTNRSDIVDHFKVEVTGLPAAWVTQPPESLYLLPYSRETTSFTFHPPLTSSSSAGAHAFEVRVTARAQGIVSVAAQGSLHIEPFHSFVAEMHPQKLRRRGRTEVSVTNTGNTVDSYTLHTRDREGMVDFDLDGKQYTLTPGYTEYVYLYVKPKRYPLFGPAPIYPFEVSVTPTAEKGGAPQNLNGDITARPWFPLYLIILMLVMLLACGIVGFLVYSDFNNRNITQQTATAVAMATGVSATATAAVQADDDADRLSNLKEIELGTLLDDPDTDDDGLLDGEEFYVWTTNPQNRDTDGDTLADGEEVKIGTDPLNRDTDGDGIPDNLDFTPTVMSTPTITPFPTIPGTNGDTCPGSPIPSRLSKGMRAEVEPGGVDNRVRDNPGKQVGAIIGYMPPTVAFLIIDGPECDADDQLRWWKVDYNGLIGWTAEGEGDEYYLKPPGEPDGGSGDEPQDASITNPPRTVVNLDRTAMGVQLNWNVDGAAWNSVMSMTDSMNLGWVKLQADWRFLEPDFSGQFDFGFQAFQLYVQEADKRGYKVLVSIAKAPGWARLTDRSADGPPDDPEALATFIGHLLERCGPHIDAIEIWNEPNLKREWSGALPFSGEGYMQLFAPAYRRIRQYSDSIIIITAGLAPAGDASNSIDDRKYLRQMYAASLHDYSDIAVGIHPYGWANPPDVRCCPAQGRGWDDAPQFYFLDNISNYRSIMLGNGDKNLKLWATEFGWATWEGLPEAPPEAWMSFNTSQHQADYAVQAFRIGQALNFMGPMFLWNMNYATASAVSNRSEIAGYSLMVIDPGNNILTRPLFNTLVGLFPDA